MGKTQRSVQTLRTCQTREAIHNAIVQNDVQHFVVVPVEKVVGISADDENWNGFARENASGQIAFNTSTSILRKNSNW